MNFKTLRAALDNLQEAAPGAHAVTPDSQAEMRDPAADLAKARESLDAIERDTETINPTEIGLRLGLQSI